MGEVTQAKKKRKKYACSSCLVRVNCAEEKVGLVRNKVSVDVVQLFVRYHHITKKQNKVFVQSQQCLMTSVKERKRKIVLSRCTVYLLACQLQVVRDQLASPLWGLLGESKVEIRDSQQWIIHYYWKLREISLKLQ